jgi:uncharacterized membrane protein
MSDPPKNHVDRLALAVHRTLITGLVASAALLIAGLVVVLVKHQPRPEGPPAETSSLIHLALNGDGVALLDLGFLALMLTPLARVLILGLGWGTERNWHFAAVAFTVLGLLAISLIIGVH